MSFSTGNLLNTETNFTFTEYTSADKLLEAAKTFISKQLPEQKPLTNKIIDLLIQLTNNLEKSWEKNEKNKSSASIIVQVEIGRHKRNLIWFIYFFIYMVKNNLNTDENINKICKFIDSKKPETLECILKLFNYFSCFKGTIFAVNQIIFDTLLLISTDSAKSLELLLSISEKKFIPIHEMIITRHKKPNFDVLCEVFSLLSQYDILDKESFLNLSRGTVAPFINKEFLGNMKKHFDDEIFQTHSKMRVSLLRKFLESQRIPNYYNATMFCAGMLPSIASRTKTKNLAVSPLFCVSRSSIFERQLLPLILRQAGVLFSVSDSKSRGIK